MAKNNNLSCAKAKLRGREAYCLTNGLVQLMSFTGGGHIAEFRFTDQSGQSRVNPLWAPPWPTIEPYRFKEKLHGAKYGPIGEARLLSGIAGHNLCLDYFGPPSDKEAAQGMGSHGEAPVAQWRKERVQVSARQAALTLGVDLPEAGLRFNREIRMGRNESVAYIRETVINSRKQDHLFHWTQHVTLGPPFLNAETCRTAISGTKGKTFPLGYGGKELLASGKEFRWPNAPGAKGGEVDLRQPISQRGLGFCLGVLMDPRRAVEFVAAVNSKEHLLMGYCFRRRDFPWAVVWEENCSRDVNPWKGRTQTRGLEFGSTPMPYPRKEAFAQGPLFGTPMYSTVPARGRLTAEYLTFLCNVPPDFGEVRDITLEAGAILAHGTAVKTPVRVPAAGLAPLLAAS
jgi:hypothetical protein